MKSIGRIALAAVAGSAITLGAWAFPPTAARATASAAAQAQVSLESMSGTVASVQNDSFTLTTSASGPRGVQHFFAERPPGNDDLHDRRQHCGGWQASRSARNASVIYRQDNGNNVAVSVSVTK